MTTTLEQVDPEIAEDHPGGDRAAIAQPRADRVGELRLRGGARGGRLGADQQVRRGLPGPALLRRLRDRRPGRGAGDRARQASSSAPSTSTCSRTRARRPTWPCTSRCSSPATRCWRPNLAHGGHLTGGQPDELLGQALQDRALRRPEGHRADRPRPGARPRARSTGPKLIIAGGSAFPARHRLQAVPRDRRRGRAPRSWPTSRIRRGWSRRACTRRRCRTPTS